MKADMKMRSTHTSQAWSKLITNKVVYVVDELSKIQKQFLRRILAACSPIDTIIYMYLELGIGTN